MSRSVATLPDTVAWMTRQRHPGQTSPHRRESRIALRASALCLLSSWPGLFRPSTFSLSRCCKTRMPGIGQGMTKSADQRCTAGALHRIRDAKQINSGWAEAKPAQDGRGSIGCASARRVLAFICLTLSEDALTKNKGRGYFTNRSADVVCTRAAAEVGYIRCILRLNLIPTVSPSLDRTAL